VGDIAFAVSNWLYPVSSLIVVVDFRVTELAIAEIQSLPPRAWRQDRMLLVHSLFLLSLILYAIASSLYLLPVSSGTIQKVGFGLLIISNVGYTAVSMLALWVLWKEYKGRRPRWSTSYYIPASQRIPQIAIEEGVAEGVSLPPPSRGEQLAKIEDWALADYMADVRQMP